MKTASLTAVVLMLAGASSALGQITLYQQNPHTPGAAGANGLSGFRGLLGGLAYDRMIRDNFTVPSGLGWTVSKVVTHWVQFTNNDVNPVRAWRVSFYNAGGLFHSAAVTNSTITVLGNIYFSRNERLITNDITPVKLPPGSYWVHVQPEVDHNWFWLTSSPTTPIFAPSAQIQRGPTAGGTDPAWPASWTDTGPTDGVFGVAYDVAFKIIGKENTDDCPADWNGDGQVDFFDYLDFVQDFNDDNADYNGDGQTDFFDYLDFVADFDAGCD
jgi:hypothetical protein